MLVMLVVRIRLLDQHREHSLIILYRVHQRIVCFLNGAYFRFTCIVNAFSFRHVYLPSVSHASPAIWQLNNRAWLLNRCELLEYGRQDYTLLVGSTWFTHRIARRKA